MSVARIFGPGQPDQTCDLVAASIVEEYLRRDPEARLNIRVCGGKGVLFVAGEVSSSADFDVSALVKQTLANCGVIGMIEPFIAFETLSPAWSLAVGAREPITATGYATNETAEFLPLSLLQARSIGRILEEKRTKDPEWFWLGADYEVEVVLAEAQKPLVLIRAEHLDTQSLEQVRGRIQSVCVPLLPDAEYRVNAAGAEIEAGLSHRMGSSGQILSAVPGVGRHLRHPSNLGTWVCRSVARRLVKAGKGKAVAVRATWLPLETRPAFVRVWNQDGQGLSAELQNDELDLSQVPASWLAPHLATAIVKQHTDAAVLLPWEH